MVDTVLAKKRKDGSTQNLNEHTFAVIEESLKLMDNDQLADIYNKIKWKKSKIQDLVFFCAYFHDIGKATFQFKETIEHEAKSYHSFYSANLLANIKSFNLYGINLLMLCVMTHHSVFNQSSKFKSAGNSKELKFEFLDCAKEFFYGYKNSYEEYMHRKCSYNFEYEEMPLKKIGIKIRHMYKCVEGIEEDTEEIDYKKIRLVYSYVLGILNLADWIASAKFNKTMPKIEFDNLMDRNELCKRLAKSIGILEFKPKNFQDKLSNFEGSILVEIPTGEGKTEGSFLWGIKNLKGKSGKLIYTLPTQTTSNKLYKRAAEVFSYDNTGLVHGASKIFLENQYEEEYGEIDNKFESNILFSKTFNKNFTVSTIDSLFKYFLNIGRYNIAMLNFLKSAIIIDEIHSYDFKMMGFIKRFLEICQYYKISVCIMSASIPYKTKKLIGIDKMPVITDSKLFAQKANYIHKVEDSLDNDLNHIIDKYNKGKNILIVRNNVRDSIKTFLSLKEKIENIVLYNSQFKKMDRMKKESEIYNKLENKEQFILVATQVVEISLDIDFDVMYTDNAPIDSLIQRFGRVNRKKNPNKLGEIFIFKNTNEKPYYYKVLELTYETIEEGLFTLSRYNEWLNIVYDKLYSDKKIEDEIQSKFRDGYNMIDKVIGKLHGIEQSQDIYDMRDIEFPKEDFILQKEYDEDNFKYDYTVSLPVYLADPRLGHLINPKFEKTYYRILNFSYNYDVGVKIPLDDKLDLFAGDD